jgi:hypothetical protein
MPLLGLTTPPNSPGLKDIGSLLSFTFAGAHFSTSIVIGASHNACTDATLYGTSATWRVWRNVSSKSLKLLDASRLFTEVFFFYCCVMLFLLRCVPRRLYSIP